MATVNKITDRVSQLSHRIFNTTANETRVVRDGNNPFKKSNFQKNILTADGFQSSTAKSTLGINDKISAGTKRIYSMFVGSITDFGSRIEAGIESVKAFCGKVANGLTHTWGKIKEIGNTDICVVKDAIINTLNRDITSFLPSGYKRGIDKMAKMDPHTEIKPMFIEALSGLEADLAAMTV